MTGEKKRANPAKKGYHPTQKNHPAQSANAAAKGARRGMVPRSLRKTKKQTPLEALT